jgi:hypothetical protein
VLALPLLMVVDGVAVQLILRRRACIGRRFRRKPYSAMVSMPTTTTSPGIVVLPGGVCWNASYLAFVFQVKTFLRFFEGATTTALISFPSWGRRFGIHADLLLLWMDGLADV